MGPVCSIKVTRQTKSVTAWRLTFPLARQSLAAGSTQRCSSSHSMNVTVVQKAAINLLQALLCSIFFDCRGESGIAHLYRRHCSNKKQMYFVASLM